MKETTRGIKFKFTTLLVEFLVVKVAERQHLQHLFFDLLCRAPTLCPDVYPSALTHFLVGSDLKERRPAKKTEVGGTMKMMEHLSKGNVQVYLFPLSSRSL